MAKDPAILFYTQDFLVGTSVFTAAQKGHYITLLCHQQQSSSGSISVEHIKILMGKDYEKAWPVISDKFDEDGNGFFNARMRQEINRRKKFSENQSRKVNKRWANSDTGEYTAEDTAVHTGVLPIIGNTFLETEIETERIVTKEGLLGGNLPRVPFLFDISTPIPAKVLELAEMNQHTLTGNSNSEFIRCQWKLFLHERLNDPPLQRAQRTQMSDLTRYFLNWIRNKHPKKNGAYNQQPSASDRKNAGRNQLIDQIAEDVNSRRKSGS